MIARPRVELPRLGRTACRVVLGTIPLARLPEAEAVTLIRHALDRGIDVLDTARAYGPAEDAVGRALADPAYDHVAVMTKSLARDGDGLRRDLEESLRRLGRSRADVFVLHQVDSGDELESIQGNAGALKALLRAHDEGLVGMVGLSGHFTPLLRRALDELPLHLLLGRFNLTMTADETSLVLEARSRGLTVATMKLFEGGFITRRTDLALRYAVHRPDLDLLLVGCDAPWQVDAALDALTGSLPLDATETAHLTADAEKLRSDAFCSYCGYCVAACPKGLPMPHIFNLDRKLAVYGESYGFAGSPGAAMYVADILAAIDGCDGCGLCEPRCPNGLPIRRMLAERRQVFRRCLGADGSAP